MNNVMIICNRFGIPREVKREMEEQALKTMGENKASFMMKDALGKVPDAEQEVRPRPVRECWIVRELIKASRTSKSSRRAWVMRSAEACRTHWAKL